MRVCVRGGLCVRAVERAPDSGYEGCAAYRLMHCKDSFYLRSGGVRTRANQAGCSVSGSRSLPETSLT